MTHWQNRSDISGIITERNELGKTDFEFLFAGNNKRENIQNRYCFLFFLKIGGTYPVYLG